MGLHVSSPLKSLAQRRYLSGSPKCRQHRPMKLHMVTVCLCLTHATGSIASASLSLQTSFNFLSTSSSLHPTSHSLSPAFSAVPCSHHHPKPRTRALCCSVMDSSLLLKPRPNGATSYGSLPSRRFEFRLFRPARLSLTDRNPTLSVLRRRSTLAPRRLEPFRSGRLAMRRPAAVSSPSYEMASWSTAPSNGFRRSSLA